MKRRILRGTALFFAAVLLLTGCAAPLSLSTETGEGSTVEIPTAPEKTTPAATVNAPMTALPDYSLPVGASTHEIRETAVRCMRDQLSVKWTPNQTIRYNKEYTLAEKDFVFEKGKVYAGLPYTSAAGSIIQFLQYYDPETGVLTVDESQINSLIGNVCGVSVVWGWAAVSTTLSGFFSPGEMTYAQGVVPVGEWTYDPSVTTFHNYHTIRICQENGEDVMYRSYAQVRAGDALDSCGLTSPGAHTVMAIGDARVVYTENGAVDPDNSCVFFQDQRGGAFVVEEDGQTVTYSGRTEASMSFRKLYLDGFVPLTIPELTGEKPYEAAEVTFTPGEGEGLASVLGGTLRSNYVLCTVRLSVTDGAGRSAGDHFINLSLTASRTVTAKQFSLDRFSKRNQGRELNFNYNVVSGEAYHLKVEAIAATGQTFVPAEIDFIG